MTPLTFNPMFAEIADKMPGVCAIWFCWGVLAVIGVGCCRVSKWLYLLMVPAAGWLALAGWHENAADRYFHDAILTELGQGYLIQSIGASCVPLVALLACGAYDLTRWGAEPIVPPNGGVATLLGNSEANERKPSVN